MYAVTAVFLAVLSAVNGTFSDQLIPSWLQRTILGESQIKILAFNLTFCENEADFCTESVHYPEQEIARAFHAQPKLMQSMFDTGYRPSQGDRSGMDTLLARRKVCDMMTRYIRPKAAKNKDGQFMFLVNDIEEGEVEHVQLVRVGQCLGEGEECGKGKIFTRQVTQCKQEYSDHKLVALDALGKELVVDTFSFPSCCSCYAQAGLEL